MLQDNKACLNSTGYEFIRIDRPKNTAIEIKNFLKDKKIFGTIYVSVEGININLAGEEKIIKSLEEIFHQHELFKNILFKHSYSDKPPFKKLKVKVKSGFLLEIYGER